MPRPGLHPLLLAGLLAPTTLLAAQAGSTTAAEELTLEATLDGALTPDRPTFTWVPGTDLVATVTPGDADLAPPVARTRPAAEATWTARFDATQLTAALEAIGARLPKPLEGKPAAMPPFSWRDADTIRLRRSDGIFHWRIGSDAAQRVLFALPAATASAFNPDDTAAAHVVDHDLWVTKDDGRHRRLTWDGSADLVYGGAAHRAEFGIRDGLWWDPTGRRLAFSREDQRPIAPYPYVDYAPLQTVAAHGRYPMAGRPHARVTIGVYDRADDSLRFLEHDPDADLYWTNVTFSPDGTELYVALVSRGQDRMELVAFDAASGERRAVLLTESDPEWVEPEHGPLFVPGGQGAFLWRSYRDGYRHLYLHRRDGSLARQVTRGAFDTAGVLGIHGSGERQHVLFLASATSPLQRHLWRAPLHGDAAAEKLTTTRGWHSCSASDDGNHVLDRYSNLDLPGRTELLALGGGAAEVLHQAEDPLARYRTGTRELFTVAASDGTPLHGLLLLPPEPSSSAKHPVLHYVYGGPHSQLVRDTWLGGANPWLHYMASRGCVVFQLDNRGTDNRGIEFAQAVFRRLGTLEVEDQLRGLAHVTALPFVDRARVGVHGWSYGGYMTLSLLTRAPQHYACGVSGAPVTDWAQYETGYTERYMDTPQENPDGYAQSSVVGRAGDLAGRLLLIQGTDDKTVMLSHSMRFVDACIDAGRLLDFMPYPMQLHGLRGKHRRHLYRTMTRYFVTHLRLEGAAKGAAESAAR